LQVPVHAVLQHTPSTQKPELHSQLPLQAVAPPVLFFATHEVPEQ
jgi:hypothetical protein